MDLQLSTQSRIFRSVCFLFFACLMFSIAAQTDSADPKDATGWFQRASDQMNLRAPDAAPFHMKVVFKALPGLELLDAKKKPQIITGNGVYEETWIAPRHWRREVTLGDYHAIEVESEAGRKMQASSDYEPSRILMLLDALLYPIQRDRISTDLERVRLRNWTIEHKTAGNLSYVLISAVEDQNVEHKPSFIFLPSGLLVQSNDRGLAASWQDYANFASHVVPGRLMIQAGGRKLLTADITVEAAGQVDPTSFELPGETADPGMTLRPLRFELRPPRDFADCTFIDDGKLPLLPVEVWGVLDRHGSVREVELLDSRNLEASTHSKNVANSLDCIRAQKVHPATIDKSPGQLASLFFENSRFSHK
jgi:hypothetical protein